MKLTPAPVGGSGDDQFSGLGAVMNLANGSPSIWLTEQILLAKVAIQRLEHHRLLDRFDGSIKATARGKAMATLPTENIVAAMPWRDL